MWQIIPNRKSATLVQSQAHIQSYHPKVRLIQDVEEENKKKTNERTVFRWQCILLFRHSMLQFWRVKIFDTRYELLLSFLGIDC
jgi:hypothetical protein